MLSVAVTTIMLSAIMLAVDVEQHYAGCCFAKYRNAKYHYAEYHYAEYHYAEYHYAEFHYVECRHAECCGAVRSTL